MLWLWSPHGTYPIQAAKHAEEASVSDVRSGGRFCAARGFTVVAFAKRLRNSMRDLPCHFRHYRGAEPIFALLLSPEVTALFLLV